LAPFWPHAAPTKDCQNFVRSRFSFFGSIKILSELFCYFRYTYCGCCSVSFGFSIRDFSVLGVRGPMDFTTRDSSADDHHVDKHSGRHMLLNTTFTFDRCGKLDQARIGPDLGLQIILYRQDLRRQSRNAM
jgi:hypothetical protein